MVPLHPAQASGKQMRIVRSSAIRVLCQIAVTPQGAMWGPFCLLDNTDVIIGSEEYLT